ncbi:MAG TPA: adenylate/guanylate cyclase domain-containing protein [Mycobacteriales bacterium]|nr:adenylate/guanylate cyclase domain-containing protein [Mycobacteriales bacterium]
MADLAAETHRALFGSAPGITGPDLAELTSTDVDRNRELWRALGFPVPDGDDPAHAADEVAALGALGRLQEAGVIDDAVALQLTRSMGRALAGIARAQAEVFEQLAVTAGADPRALVGTLAGVLPDLESLVVFVWRRHLSAAVADVIAIGEPGALRSVAVGFVDVTGFTELSRAHPVEVVRHVIRNLEARVTDAVSAVGGRVVSTLGDAVLFTVADVATAAHLALDLVALAAVDADLPPVRVGLAHGEVLSHHGDILGPVVNLAARLSEVARPGTVLVDREAAAALRTVDGVVVRRIPRISVRGYAHLEPWVLRSTAD